MDTADIGIVGLGVMGENLAINCERHGFGVVGYDRDPGKRASFTQRTHGLRTRTAASLTELVAVLARPRRVLIMVPAGAAVDAVLEALRPLLAPGDVVIDGGNSHFLDTRRRMHALASDGLLYVGLGVSGGEEGALHGPALMPGGDARAWPALQPLLASIAARAPDGTPCCAWIGPEGAGHFVKMVHNGIEYGDMQILCEAYGLMRESLGLDAPAMAEVFARWNRGPLASYLVDITARILRHMDADTGRPTVDLILDTAGQKGTGQWGTQAALDLGVAAPTLASAVFARTLSAARPARLRAAPVLAGPRPPAFQGDQAQALERLGQALLAAKLCCYAQGFQLLRAADQAYGWGLDCGAIAGLWRAGCIIRADLLEPIRAAFSRTPHQENLLLDAQFAPIMADCQGGLREVVVQAAQQGVAVPAFMSALAWYDGCRSPLLPANLLQAQRDFFGAHGYQRVDQAGMFHTQWS